MGREYIIGCGYYAGIAEGRKAAFFDTWYQNVMKYSTPKDIFVVNGGSETLPTKKGKWIDYIWNCGHAHQMDNGQKPIRSIGGWSMSFLVSCINAYHSNTDLVYSEQDCLFFNDAIEQMYLEAEEFEAGVITGRPVDSDNQGLEQSFFLVKNEFLLPFVQHYIAIDRPEGGPGYLRTERKFIEVMNGAFKGHMAFTRMGYGRGRPDFFRADENFYIQKVSEQEEQTLKGMGLIE